MQNGEGNPLEGTNADVLPFADELNVTTEPTKEEMRRRIKRYSNLTGVTRMRVTPEFAEYVEWCKFFDGGPGNSQSFFPPGPDIHDYPIEIYDQFDCKHVFLPTENSISTKTNNFRQIVIFGNGNIQEQYFDPATGTPIATLDKVFSEKSDVSQLLWIRKKTMQYTVKKFKGSTGEEVTSMTDGDRYTLPGGAIDGFVQELIYEEGALFFACSTADWPVALQLIRAKHGLCFATLDGQTPLTEAIDKGAPRELLLELIEAGAPVSGEVKHDGSMMTIPSFAIAACVDLQVLSKLFSKLDDSLRSEVFQKQIQANCAIGVLRALIESGALVNPPSGHSSLLWALERKCPYPIIELLVESGARLNHYVRVQFKDTAETMVCSSLAWALLYGGGSPAYKTISLLLRRGASPKASITVIRDTVVQQRSTLHMFCLMGAQLKLIQLLLDYGADPQVEDSSKLRALHISRFREEWDVVKLLIPYASPSDTFVRLCHQDRCVLPSCANTVGKAACVCSKCKLAQYCSDAHRLQDYQERHQTECESLFLPLFEKFASCFI